MTVSTEIEKFSIPMLRDGITDLIRWLEPSGSANSETRLHTANERNWQVLRQIAFMHGIGPYLHWRLTQQPGSEALSGELSRVFIDWLTQEYENNRIRNERMRVELAAILAAASSAGIEVIPLKGALLTEAYYPHPAMRPMADLDVLVRSKDRQGMGVVLTSLGYSHVYERIPNFYRDTYTHESSKKVVSLSGESPDNPRPVELHHELRRLMWGDVGVTDLTEKLWCEGSRGECAGQPAYVPSRSGLLQHVLLHAMEHFIIYTGRMLMWLDIAALKPQIDELLDLEYRKTLYPVLRLAQRALPKSLEYLDLMPLAEFTPAVVRHWSDTVPLDDRCGLTSISRIDRNRLQWRWLRWKPEPWRLALAYDEEHYPAALQAHGAALLRKVGVVARRTLRGTSPPEDTLD